MEKMGALMVPQIHLKNASNSSLFHVKGKEERQDYWEISKSPRSSLLTPAELSLVLRLP